MDSLEGFLLLKNLPNYENHVHTQTHTQIHKEYQNDKISIALCMASETSGWPLHFSPTKFGRTKKGKRNQIKRLAKISKSPVEYFLSLFYTHIY